MPCEYSHGRDVSFTMKRKISVLRSLIALFCLTPLCASCAPAAPLKSAAPPKSPGTQAPPLFGRTVQVDSGFPYYQDRSPRSIASEIAANGYKTVRYVITADSNVNDALLSEYRRAGIGVWYQTFCNGTYTAKDLPSGWEKWRMVLRRNLEGKPYPDDFIHLCLNDPGYRAWKKKQIAQTLKTHDFGGVDLVESHWPEYPGVESPAYGCFCEDCLAAFRKMFPEESALPYILHADAPNSPQKNPALWAKWLRFRQASLTDFLNEMVNGAGGIRASAPQKKVCVWSLALSEKDGVQRMRADSGEDCADIARTVKPDLYGLQSHWPDWVRADLPPDYVKNYRPFVDEIRRVAPQMPILIQADAGSQKQNRRSLGWLAGFEKASREVGATSTTFYEYFIQKSLYTQAPRIVVVRPALGGIEAHFSKRLDATSAADATKYALNNGARVLAARVDGSIVFQRAEGLRPNREYSLTARNIADAADRRLFNDLPPAILENQSFSFALKAASTREAAATKSAARAALIRAADFLVSRCAADGALRMGPTADGEKVVPYFANLAALGLVDAYRVTRNATYLNAAKNWVAWHDAHRNADGTIFDYTGTSGAWRSTGAADSTDSYASTYLELVAAIQRAAPDAKWLRARLPFVCQSAAAIQLTMTPRGLTYAKPDYKVMYLMDNVEVLRGLRDAATLAKSAGDTKLAAQSKLRADKNQAAIGAELWDEKSAAYFMALQPDGAKQTMTDNWYPGVMSQLMAIAWLPASTRNAALYEKLRAQYGAMIPSRITNEDELDKTVWWTMAAQNANDGLTFNNGIAALCDFDAVSKSVYNVALLGHACRVLAAAAR